MAWGDHSREYGGLGMTLADAVPIVESMGRYLMGSPFVATTLAAQALITSQGEAQKNEWLSEIASGAAASVGLTEEDGISDCKNRGDGHSKRRNPVAQQALSVSF